MKEIDCLPGKSAAMIQADLYQVLNDLRAACGFDGLKLSREESYELFNNLRAIALNAAEMGDRS